VGDLPFPNEPSPPDSSAYARSDANAMTPSTALAPSPSSSTQSSQHSPMPAYPYLNAEPSHSTLLTHSNDLGRLPVHLMSRPHPLTQETPLAHTFPSTYSAELSSFFGASGGAPVQPDPFEASSSAGFSTMGMEGAWDTAGRGSTSQTMPSQLNLAQFLSPLANQQQPFIGSDDTWSQMPSGFRSVILFFRPCFLMLTGAI
jgi:hypothetical protein